MTYLFGPNEQVCLLNAEAQCNRIWVAQTDGLRPAHFQTLGRESILEGVEAGGDLRPVQTSGQSAYEQCVRGCVGPTI